MFYSHLLFFTFTFACSSSLNRKTKREMDLKDIILDTCHQNAACAHIQMHLKETYVDELCKCGRGEECPIHWDPNDGHSITQAYNQWKFCSPISQDLPVCTREQTAREFSYEMNPVSKKVQMFMFFNCLCPENHFYEFFNEREETGGGQLAIIEERCEKVKQCEKTQICQKIETFQGKFLFKHVKCFCPGNQNCNDDLKKADATNVGDDGSVQHYMKCH
uniref:Kappa-scoloptoxin(11)-Ssd1b n=1 Tax=Scolopendra dehaani TaxID=2609776 RepID=TXB1B_SCODE|nr:RecName: Full=Kappa-scoloptoxin(11)-Ssd1b; Short=Kappa-SLPTX(11)-Ssd1b; AltName: Full=Toxin SSD282; Flags: Precursor [Scolopendra dehaani]